MRGFSTRGTLGHVSQASASLVAGVDAIIGRPKALHRPATSVKVRARSPDGVERRAFRTHAGLQGLVEVANRRLVTTRVPVLQRAAGAASVSRGFWRLALSSSAPYQPVGSRP